MTESYRFMKKTRIGLLRRMMLIAATDFCTALIKDSGQSDSRRYSRPCSNMESDNCFGTRHFFFFKVVCYVQTRSEENTTKYKMQKKSKSSVAFSITRGPLPKRENQSFGTV